MMKLVTVGMIVRDMTCARLVSIAVAHGVAICGLAGATGAISGGHLNPAVTLAFVVAGKETLIQAGLYVVAQVSLPFLENFQLKTILDTEHILISVILNCRSKTLFVDIEFLFLPTVCAALWSSSRSLVDTILYPDLLAEGFRFT